MEQQSVINSVNTAGLSKLFHFLLLQKPLLQKFFQVHKIRIACKSGKGLIGRISESGLPQRQDLPEALAGGLEKICKFIRCFSQSADAVTGRQGRNMH